MLDEATAVAPRAPPAARRWRPGGRLAIYTLLALGTLAVWQAIAAVTLPIFFPPPSEVAAAFWKTLRKAATWATRASRSASALISRW